LRVLLCWPGVDTVTAGLAQDRSFAIASHGLSDEELNLTIGFLRDIDPRLVKIQQNFGKFR
jgi:hypothetical protein